MTTVRMQANVSLYGGDGSVSTGSVPLGEWPIDTVTISQFLVDECAVGSWSPETIMMHPRDFLRLVIKRKDYPCLTDWQFDCRLRELEGRIVAGKRAWAQTKRLEPRHHGWSQPIS